MVRWRRGEIVGVDVVIRPCPQRRVEVALADRAGALGADGVVDEHGDRAVELLLVEFDLCWFLWFGS